MGNQEKPPAGEPPLQSALPTKSTLKLVANWSDLYGNRFYNLAHFEVQTALEHAPDHALLWFLRGVTELAQRDSRGAADSFGHARQHLAGAIPEPELRKLGEALGRALESVERVMAKNRLPVPPKTPFEWLEDPALIIASQSHDWKPSIQPVAIAPVQPKRTELAPPARTPSRASSPAVSKPPSMPAVTRPPSSTAVTRPPSLPAVSTVAVSAPSVSAVSIPAEQGGQWAQWEEQLRRNLDAGEYTKVMDQIDMALSRHPASHFLVEWRARALEKHGRIVESAKEFLRAAELAHQKGTLDKAREAAQQALSLARGDGDLLLAAGATLLAIGMTQQGGDALRHAEGLFRKAGDHPKLVAAVRLLAHHFPGDANYAKEFARLVYSSQAGSAAPLAPASPSTLRGTTQTTPNQRRRSNPQVTNKQAPNGFVVAAVVMSIIGFVTGVAGVTFIPILMLIFLNSAAKSARKPGDYIAIAAQVIANLVLIVALLASFFR
jgi:tetratricopeptide (TPR) repeat protein